MILEKGSLEDGTLQAELPHHQEDILLLNSVSLTLWIKKDPRGLFKIWKDYPKAELSRKGGNHLGNKATFT